MTKPKPPTHKPLPKLAASLVLALTLLGAFAWTLSAQGPLTPIGNLRGRTDSSGYLYVDCGTGCSSGSLTNNGAAPGATNLGVLGYIANAAAQSWTEGRQVLGSVDLFGAQRVLIMTAAGAVATIASDATHDSAASATGPQMMGECDDTSTDAVDEGDAGRVRIDCTNRQTYTRFLDPCSGVAKTVHVVNMSTATTVEIANAVSSQFFYICSVNLVAAAAQTVAIGEDDTDGCGSITAGLSGGATAATGWSFAANGGLTLGNGAGTVMKTATAARYLCIITGQAAQISGTITYVSAL